MIKTFTQTLTDEEETPINDDKQQVKQLPTPSMEALFFIKQFAHSYYSMEGVNGERISVSLN